MGKCEIMWFAVYSVASHSQFKKRTKASNARIVLIEFDPSCSGQAILICLVLTLEIKARSACVLFEYSMSYFVFVLWVAQMLILDRLSSNFSAADTNVI